MTTNRIGPVVGVCIWLASMPAVALAQSAIAGEVKDTTGGALPGVTVEASSAALIERSRSVITDAQGRYTIVDLRPGVYVVTYTLPGFNTVKREGVDLPGNFTVALDIELRVGALEETLTVTGAAPLVDVQSAAKTQVLSQAVLEAVPSGRSVWAYAQLVVGAAGQPDVGGSKGLHYPAPSLRGMASSENTIQIDGLTATTITNAPQYYNTQLVQEMVYQTSGVGADVSGGGLRINMIPKDGGNEFHGSFFGSYTDGAWQSDNLSDRLRQRGMTGVDRIDKIWDFNPGFGGPLLRDKLWFFGSMRYWGLDQPIADSFWADGRQNIDDNKITDGLLRLTWQVSPRNKVSAYYDRQSKFRGHDTVAGVDPATASTVWTTPNYSTQMVKFTSAVSNRLLVEVGYNGTFQWYWETMQPGIHKSRGTPEWFGGAAHRDLSRSTLFNARDGVAQTVSSRYGIQGAATYATGSHNIKVGWGWQFGWIGGVNDGNADLAQQYRDGVPDSVVIKNTPILRVGTNKLNADIGLYAQDSWTIDRLTVNAGIRYETFRASVRASCSPAGRFVGERCFDEIPNVPNWKDWAPRFGLVYDLFGDSRTALKFGFNRFNQQASPSFASRYDPVALQTAPLRWQDLNRDDVAQDNEIDFSTLPSNFGQRQLSTLDPNMSRPYALEVSGQVQHQLLPSLAVSFGYFRRTFKGDLFSDNRNLSLSDYTPLQVVSPTDGELITIYNLNAAAASRPVDIFDTNSTGDNQGRWSSAFEGTFSMRLPGGRTVTGGVGLLRAINVTCDSQDDPNTFRFCDQRDADIPFRAQYRFSAIQPLPWHLQLSASLQSEAGALVPGQGSGSSITPRATSTNASFWRLTRTTRYAADCPGACTPGALVAPTLTQTAVNVLLNQPGTEFLERYTLLDLSLSRSFRMAGLTINPQFDLFNVLNISPIHQVRTVDITAATYMQPSQTVQGRMVRLATRLEW